LVAAKQSLQTRRNDRGAAPPSRRADAHRQALDTEDVAAAVFFRASADARQITGQVLQVNGGALVGRG